METKQGTKAVVLKANGECVELDALPSLQQAQRYVNGYVELIKLADGRKLLVDEEGRLKNAPVNVAATALLGKFGATRIVGDAVLLIARGGGWG